MSEIVERVARAIAGKDGCVRNDGPGGDPYYDGLARAAIAAMPIENLREAVGMLDAHSGCPEVESEYLRVLMNAEHILSLIDKAQNNACNRS